ncbi:MAG: DUF5818 domain-containing protein [Candidatus Doudnabacteria bacterium]
MSRSLKKLIILIPAIILIAAACNKQAPVGPGNQPGNGTSFSGKLIAGGAECQLFQTDDGKQYTLTGNLAGFKTGDAVDIKGTLQEMSTCQQGEGTIAVSTITLADQTPVGAEAPAPIPSPGPCPAGQVPIGTTQSIPGHIICGPDPNKSTN